MATLYVLRGPDKGRVLEPPSEPVVIGRHGKQLHLEDDAVSREHAELRREGNGWVLRDLGSSNGTYVNGQRISGPTVLQHDDQIRLGGTLLVFSNDGDSGGRFSGATLARQTLAEAVGEAALGPDSAILSSIASNEDSVILAAPETAQAVHAWRLMFQVAEAVVTFAKVEGLLERIADLLCAHFTFDRVLILMRDEDQDTLLPQVERYRSPPAPDRPLPVSHTIINHVRTTKEGVLCADATSDHRFTNPSAEDSIQRLGLRSVLCVPITAHGEVQGIIHIDCSMAQYTYTHEQLRLATAIGRMTGMAIENARLLRSRVQNERLAAVGETVAYLSHHIRNILQGLQGGSDLLELGLSRENLQTVASGWTIIQSNLDRILHLVMDMLTFTKDRQPVLEIAALNESVQDALELVRGFAEERGVTLVTRFADMPPLPLDKDGIHQAVLNLLRNAVYACPPEGGHIELTTCYESAQTVASIIITDNGCGIPPEELPHLFEPFRSTKGHGGTGLGLAAANKVVRESGGTIEVHSTPDKGTTFTITLPGGQTRILTGFSPAD